MNLATSATALAGFAAFCVLGVTGCSGAAPPGMVMQPPTGANGAVPRGSDDWPGNLNPPATPTEIPSPLILAHGFSGFHNIGPIDYFYGVQPALVKDGHNVFVTTVDPYNSSYVRGEQLRKQVEDILAQTGAKHVNLVCHSQGGLDCRYVAHFLGNKIGAVVMISTPNHGDPVADVALGSIPSLAKDALYALLELFGKVVLDPQGNPDSDAQASLVAMSTAGVADFNAVITDHPDVKYFSLGGRANGKLGDIGCGSPAELAWVAAWDQKTDDTSLLMQPTASILSKSTSLVPLNDGLVTVDSSRWGTFLGCLPADHIQQVCQVANDHPASSGFYCVDFYRTLANWLVSRGF
jgi:triacylglycerol esterase/lipase EstA (alpha/beta hydrolase family)